MKKLVKGLREFKSEYVPAHRELMESLVHGQHPRVLFICCSDSRIVPSLITNTEPGEIFVIRNAGNIIPPFGATNGGEGAAVEYAVQALGIEQIVVCGHSHCGAMKGLLTLNKLQDSMPLVYDWLKHAEATRRLVLENYGDYQGEELLEITIAENVLTQIENLKTYPVVRSKLYQGRMFIFGWVYHLETGEVLAFDPQTHSYLAPQTQLLTYGPREEPRPGEFISTHAPPVACNLPVVAGDVQQFQIPLAPTGSTASGSTASGSSTSNSNADNGHRGEAANTAGWLDPAQAERIYRGSW